MYNMAFSFSLFHNMELAGVPITDTVNSSFNYFVLCKVDCQMGLWGIVTPIDINAVAHGVLVHYPKQ